jgi:hypothetical protein
MRNFTKKELFEYHGPAEDFKEGSDRYFAQMAVDMHGNAVRDNSIEGLIEIGKAIKQENKLE